MKIKYIPLIAALVLGSSLSQSQPLTTPTISNFGYVTGLNNIPVAGTLYNVKFEFGPYISIFDSNSPNPGPQLAELESEAIGNFFSSGPYNGWGPSIGHNVSVPTWVYTPWGSPTAFPFLDGNAVLVSFVRFSQTAAIDPDIGVFVGPIYGGTYISTYAYKPSDPPIFAVWSPVITAAVPEPENYSILLAGLGVIGAVTRRKTANRVQS